MEVKCTLCGSEAIEELSDKTRYSTLKKVYFCKQCQIVFLYPQMTEEEEADYYKDEYRKIFSCDSSTKERFENALPEAKQRRERIKHLLSKEDKVLEMGCASGYFLFSIKGLVGEIHGIEPHTEDAEYAENLGIKVFFDHKHCYKEYYNIIFMYHTLEHLRDPVKTLKEIKQLLKPNGFLVIEVPNVDDMLISVYNIEAFKNFYWQAPHYWYFTPQTLLMVLSEAGFSTELIPLQRYDLSNHITWMLEGKPGGQGKYRDILDAELNDKYKSVLCKKLLCDTLMAISKKA